MLIEEEERAPFVCVQEIIDICTLGSIHPFGYFFFFFAPLTQVVAADMDATMCPEEAGGWPSADWLRRGSAKEAKSQRGKEARTTSTNC